MSGKLLSFYAIFYLYLNRNIALTKDRVIVYHFYFSWCSWAFADLKFFQKSSTSVSSVLCIYCPPNDKLSNLQQKSVIDHKDKKNICVWPDPYRLEWLLKETQRGNLFHSEWEQQLEMMFHNVVIVVDYGVIHTRLILCFSPLEFQPQSHKSLRHVEIALE